MLVRLLDRLQVTIHPREGTETSNRFMHSSQPTGYNSPPRGDGNLDPLESIADIWELQFTPARGRKLFHVYSSPFTYLVTIHPREGTETHFLYLWYNSCECYNSPPPGDGNLHSGSDSPASAWLQFTPARGRKLIYNANRNTYLEVTIHPREGTETHTHISAQYPPACYNSPPQGDGNNRLFKMSLNASIVTIHPREGRKFSMSCNSII